MSTQSDVDELRRRVDGMYAEILIHRSELEKLRDIPDSLTEIKQAVMNVDNRLRPLENLASNIKTIRIVCIGVAIGYCLNIITTNPVVAKIIIKLAGGI